MARSSCFHKPKGVPPVVQDFHIRRRFPSFNLRQKGAEAIWRGTLQPRECSPLYHVEVRSANGWVPKVRVLRPQLVPDPPHLYQDGTLCLYWPAEWQWRRDRLIATTILPWAALWLYYYELWLDCGEWLGPSSPHGLRKKPDVTRDVA
jgi:hypothetical protein